MSSSIKKKLFSHRYQIFGPVQSILKFDDLDDAIDRANDTTYGLAAAVFTQNVTTGIQVSRLLEAGTVWLVRC